MNYEELVARIEKTVPNPTYVVAWFNEESYSEATYTITPLPDGRFTVLRPTGRGENHPYLDAERQPLVFADEEAVCEYVWQKATEPKPVPSNFADPTPEYLAEKRRKLEARFAARAAGEPE